MPHACIIPQNTNKDQAENTAEPIGDHHFQICRGICVTPNVKINRKQHADPKHRQKQDHRSDKIGPEFVGLMSVYKGRRPQIKSIGDHKAEDIEQDQNDLS